MVIIVVQRNGACERSYHDTKVQFIVHALDRLKLSLFSTNNEYFTADKNKRIELDLNPL